jgi:hypothetical protein
MEPQTFERKRMADGSGAIDMEALFSTTSSTREMTVEEMITDGMSKFFGGYMDKAREPISVMIDNLDWNALGAMSPVAKHRHVKLNAEAITGEILRTTLGT